MKITNVRPALALNIALIALFWLLLFNRIHTEWVVNTLYSYGWAVPFLALYLFSERWRDRPTAAKHRPHPAWLILPAALLLAYTPIRVINEANPDWVKINFYMTTTVAAFSAAALFAMGRFRYLWHFAFPILFVYTALPWPVWMEDRLVQTLTQWNTLVSAETLTLCGIPALAMGNVIQIGSSTVNVEEACSGIRSLQTAFMMSLFLGEFYRLNIILRVFLMLSSFLVAFLLNIGRTMTLTYVSGAYGNEALEKWHDPLGTAVMVLCLAGLWFLALGFEKLKLSGEDPDTASAPTPPAAAPAPVPVAAQTASVSVTSAAVSAPVAVAPAPVATSAIPVRSPGLVPAPFPTAFVVFGIAALVFAEVSTEAYYRYHEAKLAPPAEWVVRWPEQAEEFHRGDFPDRTRAILKYNEAETCSWKTPSGQHFQMYHIRWLPGRVSKFLSGAHYPTVCLPAAGLQFIAETGPYRCHVGNVEIPFTTFLFEAGGQRVYVFHAIIEERPAPDGEKISYRQVDSSERIDSVLRGHRNLGQRVVGISLIGPSSLEDAEHTVHDVLNNIISTKTPQAAALR